MGPNGGSVRGFKTSVFVLFLILCPPLAAWAGADYESVLDRGLKSDEAYSLSLIEKARSADRDERLQLLDEAILHAPDMPAVYFRRAAASLPDVFTSVTYLIDGARAYQRNLWWSLSLAGLLYVSLLVSLSVALLAVLVIRLPQEIPLLAHEINESKVKLLLLLLPLLLSPLGPTAVVAGVLVLTGPYLRKTGKAAAYIALLVMLTSPFTHRLANVFFSASNARMKAIVSVAEGKDNTYALKVLGGREDFHSRFSYATALKRAGRYDEAIGIFKDILKENPEPRVYTNLGNSYVGKGLRDLAKEAYENARSGGGGVAPVYNLSQVYRDGLNYEEGDKYYEEAFGLDSGKVSEFSAIASKNPNRLVIDETLTPQELRAMVWEGGRTLLSLSPMDTKVVLAVSIPLFVVFLVLSRKTGNRAFRCSGCSRILCPLCSEGRHWGTLCPDCYKEQYSPDDASPKARVAKMLLSSEQKERMRVRVRVLSFTVPGAAHIYAGKVLSGTLVMWFFLFMVLTMVLNPLFSTGMGGFSHGWLLPLSVILIVVHYVLTLMSVSSKLERGWV
jgi:tetratricopeptide (TPR) repeat protein